MKASVTQCWVNCVFALDIQLSVRACVPDLAVTVVLIACVCARDAINWLIGKR